MGLWARMVAVGEEQRARALAGQAEAMELGLSSWEYAQLQVERRKYNAPNMKYPSKVTTIERRSSASFGGTFRIDGSEISYTDRLGRTLVQSVKGATAEIQESGTIFRKNKMIIRGPGFCWVHDYKPSSTFRDRSFVNAVAEASV
jgi:hypothetical protein